MAKIRGLGCSLFNLLAVNTAWLRHARLSNKQCKPGRHSDKYDEQGDVSQHQLSIGRQQEGAALCGDVKQPVRRRHVDDRCQRKVHERIPVDVRDAMLGVRLEVDMQLRQVGLQGDLAQPGEEVDVADTQCRPEVPGDDVDHDRHPRGVRMYAVVGVFLQRKDEHEPNAKDERENNDDDRFDEVTVTERAETPSRVEIALQILDERLPVRVVVGTQHSDEADPVIETGPEQPLVQTVCRIVRKSEDELQRPENNSSHAGDVEDNGVDHSVDDQLDGHANSVSVPRPEHAHERVDAEEPVGVHGADVVHHESVVNRQTDDDHEEVQSKQHPSRSPRRKVLPHPEEREISCRKKHNIPL